MTTVRLLARAPSPYSPAPSVPTRPRPQSPLARDLNSYSPGPTYRGYPLIAPLKPITMVVFFSG